MNTSPNYPGEDLGGLAWGIVLCVILGVSTGATLGIIYALNPTAYSIPIMLVGTVSLSTFISILGIFFFPLFFKWAEEGTDYEIKWSPVKTRKLVVAEYDEETKKCFVRKRIDINISRPPYVAPGNYFFTLLYTIFLSSVLSTGAFYVIALYA